MAVVLKSKESKTVITKGDKPPVVEQGAPLKFETPPATVVVSTQMTQNLGNYNSLKVGVSLSMPCLPDEVDKTFEDVAQWVSQKIDELMSEEDADD